jgi:hypothetical protein
MDSGLKFSNETTRVSEVQAPGLDGLTGLARRILCRMNFHKIPRITTPTPTQLAALLYLFFHICAHSSSCPSPQASKPRPAATAPLRPHTATHAGHTHIPDPAWSRSVAQSTHTVPTFFIVPAAFFLCLFVRARL